MVPIRRASQIAFFIYVAFAVLLFPFGLQAEESVKLEWGAMEGVSMEPAQGLIGGSL